MDNFRGKNLDLSKCQGTRWNGDNPLTRICTPTLYTLSPTFYHRFLYGYSVMTTFSPLTVSGGPYFYYVYFPAKKGVSSVMGGETNVVSVLTPFNEGTDSLYCPQRGDYYSPFVVKTTHSGEMWEINGLT